MHYVSTRADQGAASQAPQQFSDILLGGLAPDGGLYLPSEYPQVSGAELDAWRKLSYADLAFEILRKFATDIPEADLKALCKKTYTAGVYKNARKGEKAAEITPLRVLEQDGDKTLILQALSNGPTLAFKDMAMQLLGNLFEYALAKNKAELNIFGATSGDTCQDMVKAVSNDLPFKARQKIGTVNSINWARVVAQVVYYFRGYLAATTSNEQKVSFTVPSGNFGNICAGHIARMMGLPIDRLVAATNENDVLDEFFRTGVYRVRKSAETYHTSSPSMDISKASNFERFVYDLVGRDAARVKALFHKVETQGGFDLSGKPGSDGDEFKLVSEYGFASGKSTHKDRLDTIRDVADDFDITIDTHTADGIKVARMYMAPGVPMIVLETALAAKFNETILDALGVDAERPAGFEDIESLPQKFVVMTTDVAKMKAYIASNTGL